MAKKYLSLERLTEYDELIKSVIEEGDAQSLSDSKSYTDTEVSKKANASHDHNNLYYTESEIDTKLSTVNTSISDITNGTTAVKKAEQATTANTSLDAEKLGGQLPSYYAKASDIPTGSLADKNVISESDLDSALAEKVNAAAEGNHSHSNKTVLDGITSAKVSAWDSAEANAKAHSDTNLETAKSYTDEKITALLDGADDTTLDSIKELADAIKENDTAIGALNDIAAGKANATHSHAISDVTGLQTALDGKADASHGTHVTFDSTNKPKMDGTAAFGTSTNVARADHVHPTDTSRASKADFDSHVGDSSHITSTERTNWEAAYTHSQAAHAPSDAQANVIESIKVNGTAQTITSKSVNITVPTKASDIDAAPATHGHEISEITNLQTTLNNTASAIGANTSSIATHTDQIAALEAKVGDGFEEITSQDIQNLFK